MKDFFKNYTSIFLLLLSTLRAQVEDCSTVDDASRIIIAGGSITEIIYFIGVEDKIIGLDVTSVYPEQTKDFPSIGYVRNLSAEGVLSMNPSLVLGEDDMGPPAVIKQIMKTSVDLRIIPEQHNAEGIIKKINCVGKIINQEKLVSKTIKKKIMPTVKQLKKISARNSKKEIKVMLILSMQGTSPIVAGTETSGHGFIEMIGAKNIFDSFKGWKAVTAEAIIEMNPDYILIPSRDMHKNSKVATITEHPIFAKTTAGQNKNFIIDDGMAMLGFGTRTIFSAYEAAKAINK